MHRRLWPLILVVALAGCAQAVGGCPATPVAFPTLPAPILIAPAPGATAVPAAGLTIQISAQISPDERIRLLGDDGSDISSGPLTAAPTAQYPSAVSATVPALSAHTRYAVSVTGTTPIVSSGCQRSGGPYQLGIFGGSFTTQ
jgi:hypothetical protein